jgi:hypothetical protein
MADKKSHKNKVIRPALPKDEDFFAARKLEKMERLRKAGKIKTETLDQVKKRYGFILSE